MGKKTARRFAEVYRRAEEAGYRVELTLYHETTEPGATATYVPLSAKRAGDDVTRALDLVEDYLDSPRAAKLHDVLTRRDVAERRAASWTEIATKAIDNLDKIEVEYGEFVKDVISLSTPSPDEETDGDRPATDDEVQAFSDAIEDAHTRRGGFGPSPDAGRSDGGVDRGDDAEATDSGAGGAVSPGAGAAPEGRGAGAD